MRVVDPTGQEWEVSRDWFGLPGWSRDSDTDWAYVDFPAVGDVGGDDSGVLVGIALFVAVVLLVLLLTGLLFPLLLFLAGLVVAIVALTARVLSLSDWTVIARGRERELRWRVRGLVRSRRALHEVAASLARGEVPTIDGVAGTSG